MAEISLREQIIQQLDRLSTQQQAQLLDYLEEITGTPPGTPGEVLLERMGTYGFTPEDLNEIAQAIEEGCKRI